jgi:hypothetical protein
MAKFQYSKVFKPSQQVVQEVTVRRNSNSPYSRTLSLKVGEAFVIYNASLGDVHLPYMRAKKLGIKFAVKSNFRINDKKGLLVLRVS